MQFGFYSESTSATPSLLDATGRKPKRRDVPASESLPALLEQPSIMNVSVESGRVRDFLELIGKRGAPMVLTLGHFSVFINRRV